jgi:hypothetical protein
VTAEELFWKLAAELQAEDARIVEGTIMSGRCLRVGKFLALVDFKGSGLVVKLPKAACVQRRIQCVLLGRLEQHPHEVSAGLAAELGEGAMNVVLYGCFGDRKPARDFSVPCPLRDQ